MDEDCCIAVHCGDTDFPWSSRSCWNTKFLSFPIFDKATKYTKNLACGWSVRCVEDSSVFFVSDPIGCNFSGKHLEDRKIKSLSLDGERIVQSVSIGPAEKSKPMKDFIYRWRLKPIRKPTGLGHGN